MTLDEVDVSWEIGGDFHANGLLANLRLVPDLHEISSKKGDYLHPPDDPAEDHPLSAGTFVPPQSTDRRHFVKIVRCAFVYITRVHPKQLNTGSQTCVVEVNRF
jgi:hypothetical protein